MAGTSKKTSSSHEATRSSKDPRSSKASNSSKAPESSKAPKASEKSKKHGYSILEPGILNPVPFRDWFSERVGRLGWGDAGKTVSRSKNRDKGKLGLSGYRVDKLKKDCDSAAATESSSTKSRSR